MHARDVILLQSTTLMAAILITYLVLAHQKSPTITRHHPTRVLIARKSNIPNVKNLIPCHTVPIIQLYVFTKNTKHLLRLMQSLNSADYGPATADITVFGNQTEDVQMAWEHGEYRVVTHLISHLAVHSDNETLVVIFDDHMDPSPLFALWFLIQRCISTNATAIAGGMESDGVFAGLAMSKAVWNDIVLDPTTDTIHNTASVISYLSNIPNATVVVPHTTADDRVFVRSEWQNPAYVEHEPKLMRSWDIEHKPSWGAIEANL